MSDLDDLARLAQTYLAVERCVGGRIVHRHYLCLHCGHDNSGGGCKKPTAEARKHLTRDDTGVWRVWEP